MEKSQLKIQTLFLIISLFAIIKGEQLVKLTDFCTCEQILYQEECLLNKICNFSNDKCSTIPCNQLSAGNCGKNNKCALVNNQCVNFQSCSSHNAKTEDDCDNLYHNCFFDDNEQTCQELQSLNLGSCSEDLFSICLIANEGLCVRKNGICQEMKVCEDAASDSLQCQFGELLLACESKINKCESHLKCSQSKWVDCKFAREKINGDNIYLCMEGSNGCVDFDPSIQTKANCMEMSLGFYHWDGQECSRCSWDSLQISVLAVVLLTLII